MYQIDFSHPSSLYFVGIGGISMSGLAQILADAGFRVSGSDRTKSELTGHLEVQGITVFYGHRENNITDDIDCVIFTSAIHPDNPEYIAAHEKHIPCLTRAQLLGQIMRNYKTPIAISGTHGKTTTTSMASEILMAADMDPTLSIGGILKSIGSCVRVGGPDIFLTEACEYTNSFLSFFPKIGIILNIEEAHLDFFKDLADIRSSFHQFALLLPKDGYLILNGQIPHLEEITKGVDCQILTFGLEAFCDYHPSSISFDEMGHPRFMLNSPQASLREFSLQVPGVHNLYNAMAAIALADVLSIPTQTTAQALHEFGGTSRRFEYKGSIGGITIVDDYAHHPTEVAATLKTAAGIPHREVWCVFQPHTYSRTKVFLKEFAQALSLADRVVLADIYAARETDTLGISSQDLARELQALGTSCAYFPSFDEIENFLLANCQSGDLLITMGAGDVLKIGENLLGK